jgi:hypothetical protein
MTVMTTKNTVKSKKKRATKTHLAATSTIFGMLSDALGFDCVTIYAEAAKNPKDRATIYDNAAKALPKKKTRSHG